MRPAWQVVAGTAGEPRAAWGPIVMANGNGGNGAEGKRRIPRETPRITVDACSLRGRRRTNADWHVERPPLFCMADGFGADPLAGTLARIACQEAARRWEAGCDLAQAAACANDAVRLVRDLSNAHGCGTTLLLMELADDGTTELAWAGDTAALLVRPGADSPLWLAPCDREGGFLSNALGTERPRIHRTHAALAAGDRVVLATDGVWEPLGGDLARILGEHADDPHAAAARLCRMATERGSDNATAVVVALAE